MRKLLKNIILFLTPVLIIISLLPVNKRFKYQGLKNDCYNHGIWVYDRIFNNSKAIDIAFLGSSRTINGVNDKLISGKINIGEAVNLAYCRLGRNITYVLLKEIPQDKKLKYLFIEVRENESRYSHPIFPYIAQSSDVILPNPFFNRDIFKDMWTHFAYKIEITQDIIYQNESAVPIKTDGFGFSSFKDTVSSDKLEKIKIKRSIPKTELSKVEQKFHGNYARIYLKKISEICIERNIDIFFLYLPSYGTNFDKPNEYDTYKKYGEVLIPPSHILENQTNWYDENHLNQTGANEISLWIAKQINKNCQ